MALLKDPLSPDAPDYAVSVRSAARSVLDSAVMVIDAANAIRLCQDSQG